MLPFPDVEMTLNPHPTSFNTKVRYYYVDLDFGIDIIRIHTVELNLFIPEDLVPTTGSSTSIPSEPEVTSLTL